MLAALLWLLHDFDKQLDVITVSQSSDSSSKSSCAAKAESQYK